MESKLISAIVCICSMVLVECAPLPKKFVDLTYAFDSNSAKYPPFIPFNLTVTFNGTYPTHPDIWVLSEDFTSTTHTGTHMDAPSHFIKGGIDVDDIPLENLEGPAAVIDIREKCKLDRDAVMTVEDMLNWETVTGQSLNGTIILVRTGWGQYYHSNQTAYYGNSDSDHLSMHYPGVCPDAAKWLVENRKIKGLGIDTLSLDPGNTPDFMTHIHLLGSGIYGLENVANLESMPISGAMLYVMPIKIADASGAPTRVVAVFTEVIY